MKKYAYFLPQFHRVEENDEWWGEGFTEWTNVKAARPLFKSHIQPLHPVEGNYYDLLDKKTVEWQTELMKQYSIDGMIYYHYYFCGKKLLEKPAENLLRWKDIDQNFFFCWANHSWERKATNEILMKQEYGDRRDWEEHFSYLLPFFSDSRYVKINNKPVFILFLSDFREKNDMMDLFDQLCKKAGFDGLYLIETIHGGWNFKSQMEKLNVSKQTEKILLRNPTMARYFHLTGVRKYIYRLKKKIYDKLGAKKSWVYSGDDFYRGIMREPTGDIFINSLFCGWDNTPRHGERGYVVTHPSKELFMETLSHLKDTEFVAINAWNEWAEGMILEPTEEYGCKFLQWIKEWTNQNEE